MARPIWSGSISFGLVNIPVKLLTAVSPKEVHFHMLHDKDGGRIKQKRVCTLDNQEVPYEHIAKGYEVSSGKYVMFSREEIEVLAERTTRNIEISDFVRLQEIDPIYFDGTYHLVPDRGAAKAYGLLQQAMQKSQRVGIARIVLRTKGYLCAIRPMDKALSLSTMLYDDEVISPSKLEGLPGTEAKVREPELAMANQLIESMSGSFKPEKYKDDYRERILGAIEQKAKGETIEAEEPEKPAKVIDLMSALKASLAGSGTGKKPAAGEKQHRAPPARAGKTRKSKSRSA